MTDVADSTALWRDAVRALCVFAMAPQVLGGLRLRMPSGPGRDTVISYLRSVLASDVTVRRLPVGASDEALTGGPDLAASLEAGRLVRNEGLLHAHGPLLLVIPMAERLDDRLAGHLVRALEGATPVACLTLDEGREADEIPPPALCERLALTLDLTSVRDMPRGLAFPSSDAVACARGQMVRVSASDDQIEALCLGGAALGINTLRAPLFAIRVAKLSAALDGRGAVEADDMAFAARFVLGPRATAVPTPPAAEPPSQSAAEPEPSQPNPAESEPQSEQEDERKSQGDAMPEDLVIAAASAALPASLLEGKGRQVRAGVRRNGKSGSSLVARRRGRPLASRPGRLSEGRLDLLATLKAALPWQKLRKGHAVSSAGEDATGPRIAVRRGDIHIRRYRERRESLTIFAVDASGSTAAQRLAEAKGAVEMLLADCYVRRDQVALISFRKSEASLVLPPTRSLVRAKRLLSDMPAGGGTPFAAAIKAASDLAVGAARSGLTPLMVFLTDGGANITLDGSNDRARAENEARDVARRAGAHGHRALIIDVSTRERPCTRDVAALLGARHVLLPRADANSLARAVGAGSSRS